MCYSTAIRRADRALSRIYDDALRPANLATTQFSLLSLIERAPDGSTITDLADAQVMDRTTLTRNLAPLVRDGYATVSPGRDRRTRTVHLTRDGEEVLQPARPLWQAAQERVANKHRLERMQQLLHELNTLSVPSD